MLKLYHAEPGANSLKCLIPLMEKGLDFESIYVDLHRFQHEPWFLAVNPEGQVPVLDHEGTIVTHTTVINEYLEDSFADANPLRPADAVGKARMRYWNKFVDEHVMNYVSMWGWHRFVGVLARGFESGEFEKLVERIPLQEQRDKWRTARSGFSEVDLANAKRKVAVALDKVEEQLSPNCLAGGGNIHARRHQLLLSLRHVRCAHVSRPDRSGTASTGRGMVPAHCGSVCGSEGACDARPHKPGTADLHRRSALTGAITPMPEFVDDGTIETQINYLAPGSFINRRFVAPAQEVNTGEYLPHKVAVRDARPRQAEFTLDSHGFTLLQHRSSVRNFLNPQEVEAIYPKEVVDTIISSTGADLVAPMGWMVRTSGDLAAHARKQQGSYSHSGGVQPPAGEAHVDTSPDRVDRMAQAFYQQQFPDAEPFKRFLVTSFWRTFSPPPQDCPLALCDGTTVGDDEGTPNTMFIVDSIPDREEMLRPIPDEDQVLAAAVFRHNPAHRWWYYSDMTRDEALLFKFHDSWRVKPWRVPHTAFYSNRPDANPRESIEFRSIAYFL